MISEKRTHGMALHRRLLRDMLLVCLAPLLLVGSAAYLQFKAYAEGMVRDRQERQVLAQRERIESYLRDRTAELSAITERYSLEELLQGSLQRVFDVIRRGNPIYTDVGIIDDHGNHLLYTGPYDLKGVNYSGTDWFLKLRSREVVVSDLFLGFRRVPHFIIAVKRPTATGYWILRASLSTDYFTQLVERVRVGGTGEAFLLDRQGLFQTRTLTSDPLLGPSGFPFLTPGAGVRSSEVRMRDRDFLCSYLWIMQDQWLLVFRQEGAEAFSPLRRALLIWVLITVAALVVVVSVAVAAARRLEAFIAAADAEKESLHAQLVASSRMAAVGEMAAGVAHELNNPLGIIETLRTWILDLLPERGPAAADLPEIVDSARKIGDQVERCRLITHDLLAFSRGVDAERRATDVNALLEEMIRMVEHRVDAGRITVRLEAGSLPEVVTSPSKLQQIVLNVLNNAVDAIGDGTGRVTVRSGYEGGTVRVRFEDTGCGIPPAHLSRIFEPFFTTKPVGKGTGLGLAVCFGLVRQLGGSLEVESRVGAGTTFTLTLPVAPPG